MTPIARLLTCFTLTSCLLIIPVGVAVATPPPDPNAVSASPDTAPDLTDLSLEDLMNLEITSVSKKKERLSDAAAAIYVITQEDIRRSGVTTIPEALRMAPGLQVAQITANKWAISSRGMNGEFANKLLVLVDGRSVYTPLFSGVFWDVQDTLLEDIDRIEVIRGPGATVWGANAVNGVINIITKPSEESQGAYLASGFGTNERRFVSGRWGGAIGDSAHYRLYGKWFQRDGFVDDEGNDADDDWEMGRSGFRFDWDVTSNDRVTLQGDYYRGDVGERNVLVTSLVPPEAPLGTDVVDVAGGNFLGRFTHRFSETSEASLQMYYDRTERDTDLIDEVRDTFDLEFQHGFGLWGRQELQWGGGFRTTRDRIHNGFTVSFDPDNERDNLFHGFLQDEIALLPEKLTLTVGSKFEHNDYTGFEYQPSGRVLFTPQEDHVFWGAVSRAVRTPSRADRNVALFDAERLSLETFSDVIPVGPGVSVPISFDFTSVIRVVGDEDFESERLMAYEAGYRFRPSPRFYVDLAAFYNDYSDLRTVEPGLTDTSVLQAAIPGFVAAALGMGPAPVLTEPGAFTVAALQNRMDGYTYGVELATHWNVFDWWRLSYNYTFLRIRMTPDSSSLDPTAAPDAEGNSPSHQFNLRSNVTLPHGLEFDVGLYYAENLPFEGVNSYFRTDVRVGWQATPNLALSVAAQNVFDRHHAEFGDSFFWPRSQVEHGVYGKAELRF